MKIYQKEFSYDYSFPTVTLAYFLRYPNPYSKHVMSTDVIDRYLDPKTQRLHTLRLHLKRSKVPAAVLKFLPGAMVGPGGVSQTYILEKSTVDVKEGWMETESRNMEWTGVLSVIEKQTYKDQSLGRIPSANGKKDWTTCLTTVTFISRLGQGVFSRKKKGSDTVGDEEQAPKQGFFASWSTAGIQRTIELVGVTRTKTALVNGKEGMTLVLERLRNGGIVGVLEGMRRDRMEMMGMPEASVVEGTSWRNVWQRGQTKVRHEDDDD